MKKVFFSWWFWLGLVVIAGAIIYWHNSKAEKEKQSAPANSNTTPSATK